MSERKGKKTHTETQKLTKMEVKIKKGRGGKVKKAVFQ